MRAQRIPSTKGTLAAVIHESEKNEGKLAILCPGYLDTKDYAHLVGLGEELNKQGYTVVRFDPTGTWESDGDISDYTTSQYLEDIKHVLEYMLSQGSYTKILLGGHSRGGQVSILYAARDPRITTIVGIMASSGRVLGEDREKWEKTGFRFSTRDIPGNDTERKEFRVPFHHALDRDQYDAIGDVKKIDVPVILVAGELDDLIPPEDVKAIFDHANEPKKFILMKGIGHEYRRNEKEIKLVNEKIIEELEGLTFDADPKNC